MGDIKAVLIFLIPVVMFSIGGNFFGVNYWYFDRLSPEDFKSVENALKELEIDTIRIGGLWYDANGIRTWVLEDFFKLCEDLGATPIVQIPLNGHSTEEMLSFVNEVRKIYKKRIVWSIGNEPDIYTKLKSSWIDKEGLEEVLKKYEVFLNKFKKNGDILMLPDITSIWRNRKSVEKFLKFEPDIFSIHRYPFGHVRSISEILRDPLRFYEEIENLNGFVKIPVALTETNLSWDWKFHGNLSPEGEWAGLWMVSIYLRSIVLNLWNVSTWSTVNDSSLSLLLVKNGRVEKRPTFEFMKVFKNVPRDLKSYGLSTYIDWVKMGDSVIIVNRDENTERVSVNGMEYKVPPLSVVRYDGEKKVFERSVEVGM